MGGEKYAGRRHRGDLKGSPPRGRGKGQLHPWAAFHAGITPAWAGKSSRGWRIHPPVRDHPRVGGEKRRLSECAQWAEGSPPRGRGKGGLALCWPPPPRITPAWAGKSTWAPSFKDLLQDHPRVGGEKQKTGFSGLCYVGSPPHGREKVPVLLMLLVYIGITPAWAGKSCGWASCGGLSWDHPRVGGEKPVLRCRTVCRLGSPPRGRGKVHLGAVLCNLCGITPAWAGKRSCCLRPAGPRWDHPRAGGEKAPAFLGRVCTRGSPPRRRGKVCPAKHDERQPGITPAHAGKSWARFLPRTSARDHPRVGGEKP